MDLSENVTATAASLVTKEEPDLTIFYITVGVCVPLLVFLVVLNLVCCCSQYRNYWCCRTSHFGKGILLPDVTDFQHV